MNQITTAPKWISKTAISLFFVLATVFLDFGEYARASSVEIQIQPVWPGDDYVAGVKIVPAFDPNDVLESIDGLDEFVDGEYGSWTLKTIQLENGLTEFRLQIKSTMNEKEHWHPQVKFSLPRRERLHIIPINLFPKTPLPLVLSHYERAPSEDQNQRLVAFLAAEQTIFTVVGTGSLGDLRVSPNLIKVATVYAESASWLIDRTEWFGVPENFSERRRFLNHLLFEMESNQRLARLASLPRYQRAIAALDSAPNQMIRRLWQHSFMYSNFCYDRFPIARGLHQDMVRMPDRDYNKLVKEIRIDRGLVLNEAVRCFRQLISLDGGTPYFKKEVVEREFRGDTARAVYEYLWDAALNEFLALGYIVQSDGSDAPCNERGQKGKIARLCDSFKFLKDIDEPLDWSRNNES